MTLDQLSEVIRARLDDMEHFERWGIERNRVIDGVLVRDGYTQSRLDEIVRRIQLHRLDMRRSTARLALLTLVLCGLVLAYLLGTG
jgi:hypothetical protein